MCRLDAPGGDSSPFVSRLARSVGGCILIRLALIPLLLGRCVAAVPLADLASTDDPEEAADGPAEAAAAEDCEDGADNDADGLTDCADADCVHRYSCYEDCQSGEDEDLDGLTDCADSECWSTLACVRERGIEVTVQGGHVAAVRRSVRIPQYLYASTSNQGVATGVWGTVRFLASPATTWASTSMIETCTWTVDTASFAGSSRHALGVSSTGAVDPVARTGMQVEAGCALGRSDVLPPYLAFDGESVALAEPWTAGWVTSGYDFGAPWYDGATIDSSSTTRSFVTSRGADELMSMQRVEKELSPSALPYTFLPQTATLGTP